MRGSHAGQWGGIDRWGDGGGGGVERNDILRVCAGAEGEVGIANLALENLVYPHATGVAPRLFSLWYSFAACLLAGEPASHLLTHPSAAACRLKGSDSSGRHDEPLPSDVSLLTRPFRAFGFTTASTLPWKA